MISGRGAAADRSRSRSFSQLQQRADRDNSRRVETPRRRSAIHMDHRPACSLQVAALGSRLSDTALFDWATRCGHSAAIHSARPLTLRRIPAAAAARPLAPQLTRTITATIRLLTSNHTRTAISRRHADADDDW